eukprot:m.193942 g.193942  ORF g.193942 m.193942 type:complete len:702 (+) comp53689_c0_seq3:1009-3114(+)
MAEALCTVPVAALLQLADHRNEAETGRPAYFLQTVNIDACTTPTCVRVVLEVEIAVLQTAWVAVRLLPHTVAIAHTAITLAPTHNPSPSDKLVQSAVERAVVTSYQGRHCFIAQAEGTYRVVITALTAYTNKAQTQFDLQGLHPCPHTTFRMRVVDRTGVQFTLNPSFNSSTVFNDSTKETVFRADLPPTSTLTVKWTETKKEEAAPAVAALVVAAPVVTEAAVKLPLSIVVDQHHLFSIGEGMLVIDSVFNYDIRNGTVANLEVIFDSRVRVLSVEGRSIRRWDVVQTAGEAGSSKAPPNLLRIAFDHGVDGQFELLITSEMGLHGSSGILSCPAFAHTHEAVSREKGMIAIQPNATVEIDQEGSCVGCVMVDVEELPSELRGRASAPILLAYKFLQPTYELQVSVKKHEDVDVLIAVVDVATFTATKTEEGRVMYRLVMKMRNTQKQYVRIDFSNQCDIWTVTVNAKAVKPARDNETQSVMIPLEKGGTGPGDKKHANFDVELVWVGEPPSEGSPNMTDRGTIHFSFPKVDIPLNVVQVNVFVPHEFKYSEFSGDLDECEYFTSLPVTHREESRPLQRQQYDSQLQLAGMVQDTRRLSASIGQELEEQDMFLQDLDYNMDSVQTRGVKELSSVQSRQRSRAPWRPTRAGVVPVKVDMVQGGRQFLFERFLVLQQALTLSVQFAKQTKGFFSRRRTGCCA